MSGVSSATANPPTNTDPAMPGMSMLTSQDFLQILLAEFRNQDPTAPGDPTQFATQMVDFANLGHLQNIDDSTKAKSSDSLMQAAAAFIGRDVVAPGNAIGVKGNQATQIEFAPTSNDAYQAIVSNAQGIPVDTVSLGDLSAGSLQNFTWKPSSSIPDGQYSVQIVNSKNVALGGLLQQGVVQSVALTDSGVALDLGNLVVSETQVSSVAQPNNQAEK